MLEKRVLFEDFEFPVVKGLEYLMDEENPTTDYLFINEPSEKFSMYFERGQNPFDISKTSATDKTYCLFQIKRQNRTIHFYCPERLPNRESAMWYFYVEILDENGKVSLEKFIPISYDPSTHGYYKVSGRVGNAFKDGNKLK